MHGPEAKHNSMRAPGKELQDCNTMVRKVAAVHLVLMNIVVRVLLRTADPTQHGAAQLADLQRLTYEGEHLHTSTTTLAHQ